LDEAAAGSLGGFSFAAEAGDSPAEKYEFLHSARSSSFSGLKSVIFSIRLFIRNL
jgi:hypothetical protein